MGNRLLDDEVSNGAEGAADRRFAEALAAYDEALANGQATSWTSEVATGSPGPSRRLDDARAVLRLLDQALGLLDEALGLLGTLVGLLGLVLRLLGLVVRLL